MYAAKCCVFVAIAVSFLAATTLCDQKHRINYVGQSAPLDDSSETEKLRYVGQEIPENCTANYVCDPNYRSENNQCLRWTVKKIVCNKRLVRMDIPSYVEVVTKRPRVRGRMRATHRPINVRTTTHAPVPLNGSLLVTPPPDGNIQGKKPLNVLITYCVFGTKTNPQLLNFHFTPRM